MSTVPPGSAVDVQLQLPPVRCDGATGATQVSMLGTTFPAGEAFPFLDALHRRECDAAAVAEAADVSFVSFSDGELVLRVAPTGRGDARIVDIRPTNLIAFGYGSGPFPIGLDVASVAGEQLIPVPLVPARCDPHAVLEDKRGTIFALDVELASGPAQIELYVGDAMRGEILTWVSTRCAAENVPNAG